MKIGRFKILLVVLFLAIGVNAFSQSVSKKEVLLFSRYSGENWQVWLKDLSSNHEYQLTVTSQDKKNIQCLSGGKKMFYRTANSEVYSFDPVTGEEERVLLKFGFILDQRISPDGKRIVFSRRRIDLPDDSDIWVSDINGIKAKFLTDDPRLQYFPVWSPDGTRIAYVSDGDLQTGGQAVWIMNADGKNKKRLTAGKGYLDVSPEFSSDGKELIYSSDRGGDYELWFLSLSDGKETQLTSSPGLDSGAVVSDDGKRIAFFSTRSGTSQIWIMDKNGKNVAQATSGKNPAADPCWCWMEEGTLARIKERVTNAK